MYPFTSSTMNPYSQRVFRTRRNTVASETIAGSYDCQISKLKGITVSNGETYSSANCPQEKKMYLTKANGHHTFHNSLNRLLPLLRIGQRLCRSSNGSRTSHTRRSIHSNSSINGRRAGNDVVHGNILILQFLHKFSREFGIPEFLEVTVVEGA